jgi:hypothetical protein
VDILANRFLVCLGIVLLLIMQQSVAKERPWRDWPTGNRLAIAAGGFWPNLDTKVRLDSSDGILGTTIDFETNLGMEESKALPIFVARWRISRRNAIDFAYFDLDRSGQAISDVTIRFGDVIFPANLPLNSFFDSEVYSAAWSYSFIHRPKTDIAFQIGLNIQDISVGIKGPFGNLTEEADVTAPLPTFGLSFQHFFTDKWSIDARMGIFAIDIELSSGDFSGEVVSFGAGLGFDPWRRLGFRFGMEYFAVKLDIEDEDWAGALRYDWWGPTAQITFSF